MNTNSERELKEPRPDNNWAIIGQEPDMMLYTVSDALQKVLDKADAEDIIEMSPREITMWLQHFAYVISEQYTLSTEQLLTTHNRWLTTVEYHSSITNERFKAFEEYINKKNISNWKLTEFLNYVVNYFAIDELSVVEINDTA
jgi:hypothetical protein